MVDLHAYARGAATRAGTDPDLFERQIQQESGFDPDAYNAGSDATGIAQIVPRWHPDVDPHDPIASLDYAARWMATMHRQYGSYAKALAAYNWGPGNVQGWNGRRDSLPAETRHYLDVILGPGWPEPAPIGEDTGGSPDPIPPKEPATVAANDPFRVADGPARLRSAPSTGATIVKELAVGTALVDVGDPLTDADGHTWRRVALGPVGYVADELLAPADTIGTNPQPGGQRYTFNANFPTQLQRQQWTCSIRSTMMLLDSIGISVTPDEAQDAMSPQYVNSDVGLLDASGAGIVQVLADRWGVEAFNRAPVSFDEVAGWAGQQPVAIGGRNWGHWTAVRGKRVDPSTGEATHLVLANPAGTGPRYGQQTLDRQQFEDLGWFSAVTIPLD